MIVTQILGNIHEDPLPEDVHVETVSLPSALLVKRIQRLTTDHGQEIGIRLPAGSADLRDGDLLSLQGRNAVVVSVESSDVLVIRARNILEMAITAHSLGNRHLQAQFFGKESEYAQEVMVVQYDHTVVQYLEHVGVPYTREERTMPEPFRHAEHTH